MARRREWGSGSVYRHGKRWRVAVSLGSDPFGKRIRQEWQVRTEAKARAKLRDVERRLRSGLPAEDSRMTLGVYAQEWLTGVTPTVRPSTASFYRTLAEVHLEPMAQYPLAKIGPAHIRSLIAAELDEGYSPRTVRGVLDVLRMILKQAVWDGLLARNVAELVKPPKLEQREPAHFTAAQARRFLEVAQDDELGSFFAVAVGTGCRRGELLNLGWRDVRDGQALVIRRSKSDAGIRVVPLPAFAQEALAALPKGPGPIWPVSPWVVSRRMTVICERAGLPRLGLHGLRHTASTLMMEAGVPLEVRRRLLGHSRTEMTVHYSHADDDVRRQAATQLDRLVG